MGPSNFVPEVQPQLVVVSTKIARLVQEYMSDPGNRAKYEAWLKEREST